MFANPTVSQDFPARVYRYLDDRLKVIHTTSVPKDDEAALGYFHTVCLFGPAFKPVYIERRISEAHEKEDWGVLDYKFNLQTMSVEDW